MRQVFFILLAIALTSCSQGDGTFRGKPIDVSWEGFLIKTCEVDVQYGEGASKVERFSSPSKAHCDQLTPLVNKPVTISYLRSTFGICWVCGSNDLISSVTVE